MPAKKTGDKPTAGFNLDNWESDSPGGYPLIIGGERYVSIDPLDLDYREFQKIIGTDDFDQVVKLLWPDDADAILENKLPIRAVLELNKRVIEHFGLEDFFGSAAT